MFFKYNSFQEVKKILEESLNDARAELTAWQEVRITRKKDGSEMAQLSRAIQGAKLSTAYPAHDAEHPVLYVYYRANGSYKENYINAYLYCDTLPDKGASREIIYGGGIISKTSPFTAQELREAIEKQIEALKAQIKSYEKQIEICETTFTEYREAIQKAENALKKACEAAKTPGNICETSLYYAIIKTI